VTLDSVPEPAAPETRSDTLLSEALRKLVASLPGSQRAVVVLRFQEELEPAAIAEVLGIPVNTVKSLLHRSLALLREKMERAGKMVAL
jgi:RNA polymerase sigma-70 factor (ECF subfamily)